VTSSVRYNGQPEAVGAGSAVGGSG